MLQARTLRYDAEVILDYVSQQGPQVTGIRGVLVQGALTHLKRSGLFDEYAARLPDAHRVSILEALASSWVPVAAGVTHFAVLDAMKLSEAQLSALAEPLGVSIFASMFAAFVGAIRRAGADASTWIGLAQADRVWSRMYEGGGCKVVRVGPKDALLEVTGLPFATSRCFGITHTAFLRGVLSHGAKTCFAKPVRSAVPRPDRLTVAISWV